MEVEYGRVCMLGCTNTTSRLVGIWNLGQEIRISKSQLRFGLGSRLVYEDILQQLN